MEIFELQGEYIRKMDEEQFFRFCRDNPDLRIERSADGKIEVMGPTGRETGKINIILSSNLYNWYKEHLIGEVHGPDTGFTLPNGAIRSPDAAWISDERINQIPESDKKRFAHVCPDFVIELKSVSDDINTLQNKMQEWMDNGCRLGWLIDPEQEIIWVYREGGSHEKIKGFNQKLSGENILGSFTLDLKQLRV